MSLAVLYHLYRPRLAGDPLSLALLYHPYRLRLSGDPLSLAVLQAQRQLEMLIAREMKKPMDDMELRDGKVTVRAGVWHTQTSHPLCR